MIITLPPGASGARVFVGDRDITENVKFLEVHQRPPSAIQQVEELIERERVGGTMSAAERAGALWALEKLQSIQEGERSCAVCDAYQQQTYGSAHGG